MANTDATYFHSVPAKEFPIPSNEYLPPIAYLPPTPGNDDLLPATTIMTTTTTTPPSAITPIANPYISQDSTLDSEVWTPTATVTTTTHKSHKSSTEHHHHKDFPFWDFRESIPGEPEQDYPILDKIPPTEFNCNGHLDGNVI